MNETALASLVHFSSVHKKWPSECKSDVKKNLGNATERSHLQSILEYALGSI